MVDSDSEADAPKKTYDYKEVRQLIDAARGGALFPFGQSLEEMFTFFKAAVISAETPSIMMLTCGLAASASVTVAAPPPEKDVAVTEDAGWSCQWPGCSVVNSECHYDSSTCSFEM